MTPEGHSIKRQKHLISNAVDALNLQVRGCSTCIEESWSLTAAGNVMQSKLLCRHFHNQSFPERNFSASATDIILLIAAAERVHEDDAQNRHVQQT